MTLSDAGALIAILISLGAVAFNAGAYGSRIKGLEVSVEEGKAAREKMRDQLVGLPTKEDLRQMEQRIEKSIEELKAFFGRRGDD